MAADFSWTPPLVVLALGSLAGAVVVAVRSRFKGSAAAPAAAVTEAADLQRRYDALIRRLAEGTTPEEKAAIELEAAQVLMEMESPGSRRAAAHSNETKATPLPTPTPSTPVRPTPAWVGFLYGVLAMGTLGGLFYLASQGSTERSAGGSPTGGMGMGGGGGAAASADATVTSAEDQAAILALEEAVRQAPKEIAPRIDLTRAYLRQRDLMKVFDQTKAVLEIEPGNPHALTYQALVRVAMGQAAQAETMLVEAIKKNPGIEDAYIHLAIARIQMNNRKGAEEAIAAGQKQFPEDKEQLADVFQQIANAASGDAASPAVAPGEHPEVAPASAADAPAASGKGSVVVVIDLPKGVTVSSSALLFVIAREAGFEGGPPIAVKRVPAVNFPITVTLSEKDSMSGESLPGLLRLDARVDSDGDALTKDPRDPVASEDNVRPGGSQILLVLSPGKK